MKAYQLLKKSGWCQNQFRIEENGQIVAHCLVHAINTAYDPIQSDSVKDKIERYLRANGDPLWDGLVGWNDKPTRTKDDVLNLLKICYA